MNLIADMRRRIGWKLLLSYLVVIAVAVVVMASAAQFHATAALNHHMATMEAVAGGDPALQAELDDSFHDAINEILSVAAAAAVVAAATVSVFTAQRIVGPIRAMMQASRHIAGGHYDQRVEVRGEDELHDLADSFNRMAETLEHTEQRRLALVGDLAHELRTPLSNIRVTMEGMTDGVLPAEPATFLDVEREIARLQQLIQDLEELSRAEAGQISIRTEVLDPAALIRAVAERLRPQFDDKGVALDLLLPPSLPTVRADPGRITQVLLNLLGNALQYTPAGGQTTVRAWSEGAELHVAVADSGVGIAKEHLPHIFERFYRVDKSRSRAGGGSGIGLTIAQHLVQVHGGRIWATSAGIGQGSQFTFTLPLAA